MKVYPFQTPNDTAEAVTERLLTALDLHPGKAFHLALSGGSTPALLFNLWSGAYREEIPWQRIHLYWVDERCVPAESPESNYGEAKRGFIDLVPIPSEQVFPINGEEEPATEARRYSDLLLERLPHHNGYPRFDMVILGVGPDGHTSSIFPGQSKLLQSPNTYAPSVHPASGQNRIALTARPIYEAAAVLFHATGAAKADIFDAMLNDDPESERLFPAVYIARRTPKAELYLDQAAVSHMKMLSL